MESKGIKLQFREKDFDNLVEVFCKHINKGGEISDLMELSEELAETGYSEACIKFFLDAITAISEEDLKDEERAKAVKSYVMLRVNIMLSQYDMLNTCDF